MQKLKLLQPSHQNHAQRAGVFLAVACTVLIVFLHFPFYGYITKDSYPVPPKRQSLSEGCRELRKNLTYEAVMAASKEQLEVYLECSKEYNEILAEVREIERPFSAWESVAPIVRWFGVVLNVIVSIAFVFVLFVAWLLAFRSTRTEES